MSVKSNFLNSKPHFSGPNSASPNYQVETTVNNESDSDSDLKISKRTIQRPNETPIICDKCQITFSRRHNLYVHIRKFHPGDYVPASGNQICAMCKQSFGLLSQLHDHLRSQHNVCLKFVNETFYSEDDFFEWKEKIEKENQSSFIKRSGSRKREKGLKSSYYVCHRSGRFNSKIDKRIRRVKATGSIKCGYTCPAIIKVRKQTVGDLSEICVQYQSVHIGHEIEVKKLRLSKDEKADLAVSLGAGVPIPKILDDTRKKYSPTKRYGLTTRKDLNNIRRDFKIKRNIVLSKEDSISVDILIQKIKKDNNNPVIIYKPVGDLLSEFPAVEKNEFLLGFMNDIQATLLKLYGESCVMIDSTQGINEYEYHLTTVIVRDENHEVFPVATLFSTNITAESLIPFFSAIKKQLPNFKTNVLITNDTNLYHNAWQDTFKDGAKHLLCSWHIIRNWTMKIYTKIKNKNDRMSVKQKLTDLLTEVNTMTFQKQMSDFIEMYEEKEEDFVNYFKTFYMKRSEKWAHCYRQGLGIDANMKLERWHHQLKLKHEESGGRILKRLDKAISLVMIAIAKKLISRIISMEQGMLTSKRALIRKHHKTSLEMGENYNVIKKDHKYIITETEEDSSILTFDVEESNIICSCPIRCEECNICIHSMSCTCIDYCIRFAICKHIHYVCHRLKSIPSVTSEDSVEESLGVEYDDLPVEHDSEKQTVIFIVQNVESHKNKVLNKIELLHQRLQSFDSVDIFQHVENNIDALNEYLDRSIIQFPQ